MLILSHVPWAGRALGVKLVSLDSHSSAHSLVHRPFAGGHRVKHFHSLLSLKAGWDQWHRNSRKAIRSRVWGTGGRGVQGVMFRRGAHARPGTRVWKGWTGWVRHFISVRQEGGASDALSP